MITGSLGAFASVCALGLNIISNIQRRSYTLLPSFCHQKHGHAPNHVPWNVQSVR
jgi:hypothetical protein